MTSQSSSQQPPGHIAIEGHAGVLVARLHGGPLEEEEDGARLVVRLPAVAKRRASAQQAAAVR